MGPVAPDRGEDRKESAHHRLGAPGGPIGGPGGLGPGWDLSPLEGCRGMKVRVTWGDFWWRWR